MDSSSYYILLYIKCLQQVILEVVMVPGSSNFILQLEQNLNITQSYLQSILTINANVFYSQ